MNKNYRKTINLQVGVFNYSTQKFLAETTINLQVGVFNYSTL